MTQITLFATTANGIEALTIEQAQDAAEYMECHGLKQVYGDFEDEVRTLTDKEFTVKTFDLTNQVHKQQYDRILIEYGIHI